MGRTLVIVVVSLLFLELAYGALTPCLRVDDCSCKLQNSDKQINIRSLGYSDEKKAPRFGYKQYDTGFPWDYAYNPCYAWSDGTSNCKNVVGCQRSHSSHTNTFDIGGVTATWKDDGKDYYVQYAGSSPRSTLVVLKCDAAAKTPTLALDSQQDNQYHFTLTSECCCPGKCLTPASGSISVGSVICIVASLLIVVYLIGGVLFMKFARNAEGSDLIPNKELWGGLFASIKDGFLFVFTCGKRSGYSGTES